VADLHLEGLDTLEVAAHVDQGLASLHARLSTPEGVEGEFPILDERSHLEVAELLEQVCDAWDQIADILPGFREDTEE
jgi:hypothetical protein